MGHDTRSPRRSQGAPAWSNETLRSLRIWAIAFLASRAIYGATAADLAQRALLALIQSASFDPGATFDPGAARAWFTGILRHEWLSYRRWFVTRAEVPLFIAERESDAAELAGPSHEGRVEARELGRVLASSTTPERWRAIVGSAQGFTAAELAAAEGIPLGTLYSRLWKGRAAVVRALVLVLLQARRSLRSK
jgi:DNA-directed RNA polymerase specialized sigma24 family protein